MKRDLDPRAREELISRYLPFARNLASRYLNGREYDLNGAAADAWRERAAGKAGSYDFQADGGRFYRSQWFDHCIKLADYYGNLAHGGMAVSLLERSDVA